MRLCIGVYDVPRTVGHRRKRDAKDALLRLLPAALQTLDVVEIATHDEQLIEQTRAILEREQVPKELEGWQFTRLHGGVSGRVAATLSEDGMLYVAQRSGGANLKGWRYVPNRSFRYTDSKRNRLRGFS